MLLVDEYMLRNGTLCMIGEDYEIIDEIREDNYEEMIDGVVDNFRVKGMLLDRNKLNNQTIYLIGKNYGIEEKVGEGMEEYVERVVKELSI